MFIVTGTSLGSDCKDKYILPHSTFTFYAKTFTYFRHD